MLLIVVSSLSFILYDWRFYLANLSITFAVSCLMDIAYNRPLSKAICNQKWPLATAFQKQVKQFFAPIRSSFYLLVVIFSVHTLWGNWIDGIKVTLRFCNIILFATWVLWTTSQSDIIEGLASLFKPLSYLGLKPAKVSIAFALAIRFIPLIIDTFKEVKTAQKAKGIDKNFIAILIPSIIKTIKMADDIAEAIEARSWE